MIKKILKREEPTGLELIYSVMKNGAKQEDF